jgi:hypothetical protein
LEYSKNLTLHECKQPTYIKPAGSVKLAACVGDLKAKNDTLDDLRQEYLVQAEALSNSSVDLRNCQQAQGQMGDKTDLQLLIQSSEFKNIKLETLQTLRNFNLESIKLLTPEEQKNLEKRDFELVSTYYHLSVAQTCFDEICGQKSTIESLHKKVVRRHRQLNDESPSDLIDNFK